MTLPVDASWCLAIAGILLGVGALAVFRQPLMALRVTLDFFLAAGLLRLSVDVSWETIAATVTVVAVRRLITRSLTADLSGLVRPSRTIG